MRMVGPIESTWAHPLTGVVFGVRGRGWTESDARDTGEGRYDVFAPMWEAGAGRVRGSGRPGRDPPIRRDVH